MDARHCRRGVAAAAEINAMEYLWQRLRSFACAFNGVRVLLSTQAHARLHLLASIGVIGAGLYFDVSRSDWAVLTMAMASVWVSEALNTAVEFVVDLHSPAYHPLAGKAKDVAAGAVLLASFFAAMVGVMVFADKWGLQ
jgi:diacylglycerol kinase (ATP)